MPDATITSTASTFGTITGTFAADQSTVTGTITGTVTGTLTGSVGVPGPQGPTGATGATGATGPAGSPGAPGQGVPVGGTAGQFLTKIDGTNYNTDWTTVNLSVYAVKANNLSDLADAPTARTNLGLGSLAVVNDAPSNGSQYARKNAAWDIVIPGDRYLTSSTTSNTIGNGNKTFTIGTGLSYTPTQNITISYDASNHMHGEVLTYNSGTGVLTVDINHHTGSGTYAAWVVNVGGVTPDTSVAWGAITGTLSTQTDLQNALDLKANLASPSLTGTPLSTTAAVDTNTTQIATTAFVVGQASSTSPVIDGTATVGTSLKYARADHVHPTDTSRAALNSPTFTGTPTLPTGTIATTQSPGNNTTAVATTAFVTAAVPALATVANAFVQNNTAAVTSLTSLLASATPAVFHPMPVSMSAAQSGTGATSSPGGSSITPMFISLQAPNALTTGYAAKGIIIGSPSLTNAGSINWSKPMAHSCRLSSGTLGTAKTDVKIRAVIGRDGNTFQAASTLAVRGFGWEFDHFTGVLSAIAHNGSTLTTTAVTFTPVNFRPVDITSYSDGAGNISIYVNGVLAGTGTGGPTGVVGVTNIWVQWEIQNTSALSPANTSCSMGNPKVVITF